MPTVTIVRDDRVITVDGDPEYFDFTLPDPNIRAVQWNGTRGEVEFDDRPNQRISSLSAFQYLLPLRVAARQARLDAEAAARAAAEAAAEADMTPRQKRWREYPDIRLQLEAMYEARQGNPTKLNAVDAAIAAVNAKYPIP